MNWKLPSVIPVLACLAFTCFWAGAGSAFTQSSAQQSGALPSVAQPANAPRAKYTTPPKTSVANLKSGESNVYQVRGKVTFTLTAANTDDTVTGILVYTIPDEARQKIAQVSGKPLKSIPASVVKKDVTAGFREGTACPVVSIETGAMEMDVAGVMLSFNRIVADVIETPAEVPQHLCAWTRQINAKRQRRGIVASLNRLIIAEQ